jgi:hypothetical protein
MCFRKASDSKEALLHCHAVTCVGSDFYSQKFPIVINFYISFILIIFKEPTLKLCYLSEQDPHKILRILYCLLPPPLKKLFLEDLYRRSVRSENTEETSCEIKVNFFLIGRR